jgi:hypothetical protein
MPDLVRNIQHPGHAVGGLLDGDALRVTVDHAAERHHPRLDAHVDLPGVDARIRLQLALHGLLQPVVAHDQLVGISLGAHLRSSPWGSICRS